MIVLDTNVLSEPLKQQPDEHVLVWLASLDEEAGVTSVSVGELLTGVRALPAGRRREGLLEAIEATLRTFAGKNICLKLSPLKFTMNSTAKPITRPIKL